MPLRAPSGLPAGDRQGWGGPAGILGDLEAAVRREPGADQIPPKSGSRGIIPDSSLRERVRARRGSALSDSELAPPIHCRSEIVAAGERGR